MSNISIAYHLNVKKTLFVKAVIINSLNESKRHCTNLYVLMVIIKSIYCYQAYSGLIPYRGLMATMI